MDVDIRAGRHDDTAEVLVIWAATDVEETITDDADSLRLLVTHDPGALLAESEGRLVATWDGWRGGVWRLAVHPDQRR